MAPAVRVSQVISFLCCSLLLLVAAVAQDQEPVQLVTLRLRNPLPAADHLPLIQPSSPPPLAAVLSVEHLREVSTTVLAAETWLRTHILSAYPTTKLTHIVVGHNVACSPTHEQHSLVLPSLKNLHRSLTRWGLQHEIKLSPSLSSHCFHHNNVALLLDFIRDTNSTYILNVSAQRLPHSTTPVTPREIHELLSSLKNSPSFHPDLQILSIHHPQSEIHPRPSSRKLSSYLQNPHLSSYPSYIATSPLPPLIGSSSSPAPYHYPSPLPFPPYHNSPPSTVFPTPPPPSYHLPPCKPSPSPSPSTPSPEEGWQKLWCVAKPSVPADTLKDSLDFACGEADCDQIQPSGTCYNPDTLVAHASYAFNSYWQKTKRDGGTCDFGGTAMIINSDPSYLQCTFAYN